MISQTNISLLRFTLLVTTINEKDGENVKEFELGQECVVMSIFKEQDQEGHWGDDTNTKKRLLRRIYSPFE